MTSRPLDQADVCPEAKRNGPYLGRRREAAEGRVRLGLGSLVAALRRCPTRAAWCELLAWAALAAVPAELARVFSGTSDSGGRNRVEPAVARSALVVPIRSGRSVHGRLVLVGPRSPGGFRPEHLRLLMSLVEIVGDTWPRRQPPARSVEPARFGSTVRRGHRP